MEKTDAVTELCKQLENFHISARLQRQAEEEALALNQDGLWFLDQLPFVWNWKAGVRAPEDGHRPCWEPPVLDYSFFEALLEGDRELAKEDGSKDIAWRWDVMDNHVEEILVETYHDCIIRQQKERIDVNMGLSFWNNLLDEVEIDLLEIWAEGCAIYKRHNKDAREAVDLKRGVGRFAQEKDARFSRDAPLWLLDLQ